MDRKVKSIGDREFWLVGSPQIQRDAHGHFHEYIPEMPEGQRANRYAAGPFCKFGLPAAPRAPGVYAVLVDEQLKYIGRCEDLAKRFGSSGYGSISQRNLHDDGQSTNCKLNARVLATAQQGQLMQVWFHSTPDFVELEQQLIGALLPEWNGQLALAGRSERSRRSKTPGSRTSTPGAGGGPGRVAAEFDAALRKLLDEAAKAGMTELEVRAGALHRLVGGYPGTHHRMPSCCARMRAAMGPSDRIVHSPPKGNGANLCIAYRLPKV